MARRATFILVPCALLGIFATPALAADRPVPAATKTKSTVRPAPSPNPGGERPLPTAPAGPTYVPNQGSACDPNG